MHHFYVVTLAQRQVRQAVNLVTAVRFRHVTPYAPLAQRLERLAYIQRAGGSNPSRGTMGLASGDDCGNLNSRQAGPTPVGSIILKHPMRKTNVIDFRMDDCLAEKKEDGTTIHVEVDDVRKFYGETVAYLLSKEGSVRIVENPEGPIKRAIIVK